MLNDNELNLQSEKFVAYFGRLNPPRNLKTTFEFWAGGKDFNGEDSKKIWRKVKEEYKNGICSNESKSSQKDSGQFILQEFFTLLYCEAGFQDF